MHHFSSTLKDSFHSEVFPASPLTWLNTIMKPSPAAPYLHLFNRPHIQCFFLFLFFSFFSPFFSLSPSLVTFRNVPQSSLCSMLPSYVISSTLKVRYLTVWTDAQCVTAVEHLTHTFILQLSCQWSNECSALVSSLSTMRRS